MTARDTWPRHRPAEVGLDIVSKRLSKPCQAYWRHADSPREPHQEGCAATTRSFSRENLEARHRDCARTAVAVRDRGRRCDNRQDRRTGGLQQAPRQHDDLAGLPRAEPRQRRRRRPAANRDRRRPLVRRNGRLVAPAPDARARILPTLDYGRWLHHLGHRTLRGVRVTFTTVADRLVGRVQPRSHGSRAIRAVFNYRSKLDTGMWSGHASTPTAALAG
jgi:hypothetical protein